jgi:hypothetical protein
VLDTKRTIRRTLCRWGTGMKLHGPRTRQAVRERVAHDQSRRVSSRRS